MSEAVEKYSGYRLNSGFLYKNSKNAFHALQRARTDEEEMLEEKKKLHKKLIVVILCQYALNSIHEEFTFSVEKEE